MQIAEACIRPQEALRTLGIFNGTKENKFRDESTRGESFNLSRGSK